MHALAGVLLRRLLNDPMLDSISHVVLDEVHERSVEIDLLLMLLRDVGVARCVRCTSDICCTSAHATQGRERGEVCELYI